MLNSYLLVLTRQFMFCLQTCTVDTDWELCSLLALVHITAKTSLQFSFQSQRRAWEINSFLTFAKNAGKLLVSWSRLSKTGKHLSTGSLDTTVEIEVLDFRSHLQWLLQDKAEDI